MYNNHCHSGDRFFERLAENPRLESGLQRLEHSPAQDPAVRELAAAVREECERARRRKTYRLIGGIIGFLIGVIFLIVIIVKQPSGRRH